jgi:Mn2+/Fe2+ NRAMP family transporter
LHGVAAFLLIGVGRYVLFERVMKLFAAVKFGIVVLLGVLLAPSLSELALGLVPRIPEGSFWNILAVIGGVGGTFTLASYGYWVREHGWRRPEWIPTMRIDVVTGYVLTGVFMVSMMIVGAQLLYGTGTSIEGNEGLVTLANPLEERFGPFVRWLFLIGFWAVATGAMLGSWNGGAHLFADYVRIARGVSDEEAAGEISEKSPWFRAFLVWITFPPMVLLIFGRPITLVIVYASLGALFFPFLALTLLYLLNSRRVDPEYRNRTLTNVVLVAAVLLFIAAGVQEVLNGLSGRSGG